MARMGRARRGYSQRWMEIITAIDAEMIIIEK
jgi:hypothetical protein